MKVNKTIQGKTKTNNKKIKQTKAKNKKNQYPGCLSIRNQKYLSGFFCSFLCFNKRIVSTKLNSLKHNSPCQGNLNILIIVSIKCSLVWSLNTDGIPI